MAANYGLHSEGLGSFLGSLKWGMHILLGMTAKYKVYHLLDKLLLEHIFICTKKVSKYDVQEKKTLLQIKIVLQ